MSSKHETPSLLCSSCDIEQCWLLGGGSHGGCNFGDGIAVDRRFRAKGPRRSFEFSAKRLESGGRQFKP